MRLSIPHRQTLTYTCAFCEHLQSAERLSAKSRSSYRPESLTPKKTSLPRSFRGLDLSRDLHTTQRRPTGDPTVASSSSQEPPLEYSFSIAPKQPKPSRTSQIRESLKQWSTQNARIKEGEAIDALPYEGKVKKLPNALFIGMEQEPMEEEQDQFDKQNDDTISDNFDEQVVDPGVELIQPGSLRTIKSRLIHRQNGVYLGDIGTQSLFLLSNGKWAALKIPSKRAGISTSYGVVVPNFLSIDEVEYLRSYMPRRDVERAVGRDTVPSAIEITDALPDEVVASILPKLRLFTDGEYRFLRKHKVQMEQMYHSLSHEEAWRATPVQELPRLVLGIDYEAMTWLERKAFVDFANDSHPLFIPTQTASTVTYYLAPKRLDRDIASVETWARSYQEAAAQAAMGKNVSDMLRSNPLSSFIDKARRIIMKSRKIRTPTSLGILGPAKERTERESKTKVTSGEVFTSDDKAIINYLYDVTLRRPASRTTTAHAALIVRAVGAYPDMELSLDAFRMLLQEIGCVDPWATFEAIDMPLPGRRGSTEIDQLDHEARRSIEVITDIKTDATTLIDTLSHLRKDWGGMAVFCVDSPGTQNIEDGISIEPATDLEGGYWIHTHIAHPTAHLSLDHPVAKYARKRGAAYYDSLEGGKIHTMVPPSIIRQFSIKKNSPVLTISTLVTMNGQVHNVKVVPGLVQNVQRVHVGVLGELMGIKESEQAVLIVGDASSFSKRTPLGKQKFSKREIQETLPFLPQFQLLSELLIARRTYRMKEVETPADLVQISSTMSSYVRLPEINTPDRQAESYHWKGDPDIAIWGNRRTEISRGSGEYGGASRLITQAMRLATESMGKWLGDRNIPAVFLGSSPPTGLSIQEMNERDIHTEIAAPVFTRTSYPKSLFNRNMKQCAPCTSPMRKHHDMLNHFQVDSYFRAQSHGQINPDNTVHDDSVLALSRTAIEEYLARDAAAGDHIDDLTRSARKFWALQAIFRAFHFKEANLPEIFEVHITSPTRRNATGLLEPAAAKLVPWSLPVILEPTSEGFETTARIRDFIPVKFIRVDPNRGTIFARAVGPPSEEQRIIDPIRCCGSHNILELMQTG